MKEEHLTVPTKRIKKYNSYKGEITPKVGNIINREFHAEQPNIKWLTDITEFAIPTRSKHPLVHTDRECHYRWSGWIERMQAAGLVRSTSKKGCSPGNAACERFFGKLKNEMFYGRPWVGVSIEDFINEINSYMPKS